MADDRDDLDNTQPYFDPSEGYEPEPPERVYRVEDVEPSDSSGGGLSNLLLVGLIIGAVVVGALIMYLLLRPGDSNTSGARPSTTPVTDTSWQRVRSSGRLVVGTSLDYPPFGYRDENFQPTGFDIALIRDMANRLGVTVEIKDMAFDGLGGALNLGQIDAAIAAISVTPEREAAVDFTNIYFVGEEGTLARVDSPITSVTTLSDMAGRRVGVQRGTVYETWLQRDLVDSGITSAANLFVYETADAAIRDLREQRLDLVVLDLQAAQAAGAQGGVKLVGRGMNPQRYAIAVRNGADSLRQQLNNALIQLQNEGVIAQLARTYLNIDPSDLVTPTAPTATPVTAATATPGNATPAPCVNGMRFVADLNLDDQNMKAPPPISPGQPFSKGWRILNSGTCAWNSSFRLVYVSGNVPAASMGGQPTPVQGTVAPGQQYDMFVAMVAPLTPGVYQGIWQMTDAAGQPFGDRIWVGITVPAAPTATPAPTQTPSPSINFTVNSNNIQQGQCAIFNWTVQNAVAVYFYAQGEAWQSNQVPPQGSRQVCPVTTTTYFLRVLNPDGTVEERQITVTVRPNVNAPTIAQFIANPPQVTVGQCVQLQWDVQGSVSNVTIANQFRVIWDNAPSRGNTQDCTGAPAVIEYRLQATGPGGSSQALDYVTVVSPSTATPVPTQAPTLPVIDSFSVTPPQIQTGQCIQINWSTSGATWLVRLLRNNVLVLDNAALAGSAQDCLQTPGTYVYQLVASTASGQSTSRDQSVLVSQAPPVNPLAGKSFAIIGVNGNATLNETITTATFNSDGRINGSGGCNDYSGRYSVDGARINISELNTSNAFCVTPPGLMEQEEAFFNALRAATTYEYDENLRRLIMRDAASQEVIRGVLK